MCSSHERWRRVHHAESLPFWSSTVLLSWSARALDESRAALTSFSRSALALVCAAAARSSACLARAASSVNWSESAMFGLPFGRGENGAGHRQVDWSGLTSCLSSQVSDPFATLRHRASIVKERTQAEPRRLRHAR